MNFIATLIAISFIAGVTGNAIGADDLAPLRLIALDVGEGQSILLQRGQHGVLIDTGHAGKARHVLDRLQTYGVTQLDYLLLTHLHPDHASGYFRIREAFPKLPVLVHNLPFDNTNMPDMVRWVAEALESDSNRRQFRVGDQLDWQGSVIKPLWPKNSVGGNLNDESLVLEVVIGFSRVLLMGDVGDKIEQLLINENKLSGPYDVFVAGHHGSSGTSSDAFLQIVKPAYAIVSTNAGNIRGYPAGETVKRLRQFSSKALFMTFDYGDICLQWEPITSLPVKCITQSP
jgi:competence protein ComEC